MDIGIGLPATIPGTRRDQMLEWARRAEARGFSTLGTIDRLVYGGQEPLIALAAAAAVTERIRLATGILLAPLRANGAILAKQAASLDALSDGRLVLGVAVGGRPDDYEAAGVPFRARGRIFDEMLDRWVRIWDGEPFGTAGRIGPAPPRGRPTLIFGGMADAALARAARYGDGWTVGNETPERYARERARLQAAWDAAGRTDAPHTLAQPYYALGPNAKQAAERSLRDYYTFAGDYADTIVASAVTDADTVRRLVREFEVVGCDELLFFPCDPDPDQVDLLADALA